MKYLIPIALLLFAILSIILFVPRQGHTQVASITLDFTAPGDDGNVGTASSYQLRYSSNPVVGTDTLSWWNAATTYTTLPAPQVAGTRQTIIVSPATPFVTGRTYFFLMKACDEVPNCSGFSNMASKLLPDVTPPAPIIDLRVL